MVEEKGEGGYGIELQKGHVGANGVAQMAIRSNPATNDWVPKIDEDLVLLFGVCY